MKPGEYIGKDGRTYRVLSVILLEDGNPDDVMPQDADWPAAKAALDALIVSADLDKPAYTHDSDCCTFLGGYVHEGERFDLYWCAQKQLGIPTVIARWSSNGEDYYSGTCFVDVNPTLAEAQRRATEQGLIEAEAENGQWVLIDGQRRLRVDGTQPQWNELDSGWMNADDRWAKAYRKGREVALEQVQELVEAVEDDPLGETIGGTFTGYCVPGKWLSRVQDLAKKVKL
jgi:hypothetical protein